MKTKTLRTASMVAGLFHIILAGLAGHAAGSRPETLPTIRLGHVGHNHQLALYVAALESESLQDAWGVCLRVLKAKEVYELVDGDQPIARLHLIQTDGGAGMPAALSRGEFDLGLGSTIAVAKLADGGQPLKIIAPLQTDGNQFVMRKGSPITDWPAFVAAAQVAGKPLKIGYKEPMAGAKMIFERALKAEGIAYSYGDRGGRGVVLVNFGSEKSPLPLLEIGALDGFVMNQPGPAMAVHKGLAQVVAELRDLPPKGKWVNHPCCCVAATEKAIRSHGEPIKAILKLLLLSTQLIHDDPALAIDCAVRWTRNPHAVEAQSVPTVTYLAYPTEGWIAGMKTWLEMVKAVDFFNGKYAQISEDDFVRDLCSIELCRTAMRELQHNGQLHIP